MRKLATALTLAGAIPFVGSALAAWLLPFCRDAATIANSYGAIILTFLAGIHWGMVMGRLQQNDAASHHMILVLIWSNMAALIAWMTFLTYPAYALNTALLMMMFLIQWLLDVRLLSSWYPSWFVRLRSVVSMIVIISLGALWVKLLQEYPQTLLGMS